MAASHYLQYFQSAQAKSDLAKAQRLACSRLVIPFQEITQKDIELVGAKNASLGEMYNSLSRGGVRVPGGFAITTDAYHYFLYHNQLAHKIKKALHGLKSSDLNRISYVGEKIRNWISQGELPDRLETQICSAYRLLESRYGRDTAVAVRGSTTLSYVPGAPSSGQQDSLLDIVGERELLRAFRSVLASLFSDRAIVQRLNTGVEAMAVDISVGVQRMVQAARAASGTITTLDPETGFRDVVFITSSFGFGDGLQSGRLEPDEFYVHKPSLAESRGAIIKRELGGTVAGQSRLSDPAHGAKTYDSQRCTFSLTPDEVLELSRLALTIEEHYSRLAGKPTPMDIEWAKDSQTGDMYIVQARPEALHSRRDGHIQTWYSLTEPGWIIASGRSVGNKIISGSPRVIHNPHHMNRLREGEILITRFTDDSWDAVLHRAAAVVTERGGRAGHAARFARNHGIPAIVGAANATKLIPTGRAVTLSCRDRDDGFVYEGALNFCSHRLDSSQLNRCATGLDLTISNPNHAFDYFHLPVNGVGLVKLEYIIWHNIGVHPRALLQIEQADSGLQREITDVCSAYGGRREYYVERLVEGIAMVAAAFNPRPVTVRFSDFKSDEFAALKGGELFEDNDANPMIGFRGAVRFLSDDFRESFSLECAAIRRVREEMGFKNTHVLIPFVRTVEESKQVIALMEENGLRRGDEGLKLLLMCETPANILLAEQFIADYDGFMIGLDDLSQLTVGYDSGARKVKGYSADTAALLKLISMAVEQCQKDGKYIGVCGLGRDVDEDFVEWLVSEGVDSISIEPDNYEKTLAAVLRSESQQESPGVPKLRA